MRIGSLFSGYGGLDITVAATLGGTIAWHCDNDPAAARVLAHHWPDTPNLGDITAVDWANLRGHLMPAPKEEHARRYNMGCNGSVHRCGIEEVMPEEASTVDVLVGGFP